MVMTEDNSRPDRGTNKMNEQDAEVRAGRDWISWFSHDDKLFSEAAGRSAQSEQCGEDVFLMAPSALVFH